MRGGLSLRRYRQGDGSRVRELHETAMRDVDAYTEGVADDDLEAVSETYLEGGGEFLVGEIDERIVAMGAFRPIDETDSLDRDVSERSGSTVELTRVRVDPDHQRYGYGRRLCAELEDRARSQGVTHIVLDTTAKQTAARRLYESMGYEETHRGRIEDFGDPFTLIVYEKSLVGDE
ncbi:GNAT family N-acetyltransferase [Natrinema salinisoli]|uniref:GNAT family N-acetyltransferase n=1 Tax=Natrinema salinisoli TaxID=2878535 RepID=UPI001CF03ECE|nr:GNAT family N-acetyltransferase [Natrinema salinisoli]